MDEKGTEKKTKILNIATYEEETYYSMYTDSNPEQFDRMLDMEVYPYQIIESFEQATGFEIEYIRFIMMDEEYFEWLGVNKLDDNDDSRIRYINTLSDAKAEELWEKHERGFYIDVALMPVTFVKEHVFQETLYSVPIEEETFKDFKFKLAQDLEIEIENIHIIGTLATPGQATSSYDDIQSYYFDYFRGYKDRFVFQGEQKAVKPLTEFTRVMIIGIYSKQPCIITREMAKRQDELDYYKTLGSDTLNSLKGILKELYPKYKEINVVDSFVPQDAFGQELN